MNFNLLPILILAFFACCSTQKQSKVIGGTLKYDSTWKWVDYKPFQCHYPMMDSTMKVDTIYKF